MASAHSSCGSEPLPRTVDVLADLRGARAALNRAIAALEKAGA